MPNWAKKWRCQSFQSRNRAMGQRRKTEVGARRTSFQPKSEILAVSFSRRGDQKWPRSALDSAPPSCPPARRILRTSQTGATRRHRSRDAVPERRRCALQRKHNHRSGIEADTAIWRAASNATHLQRHLGLLVVVEPPRGLSHRVEEVVAPKHSNYAAHLRLQIRRVAGRLPSGRMA